MRTIEISASRSVKVANMTTEARKAYVPANHKDADIVLSAGPEDVEVPANLEEMITVMGKDKVYDLAMKQHRTDLGNAMATRILDKVTDPSKTGRKAGAAIKVTL